MNGITSFSNKLRGSVSMANTIINGGASPYPKHVGPAPICSFSDGAQDAPLKSLKFYIEPSQDLHGYSYPWPGGGGKNLTSMESVTTAANGGITEASSGQIATLQGGVTYTISFDLLAAAQPGHSDGNRLGIYYNNATQAARFELTATGRQTATFTPPSDCYINFWCGAGVYAGSTKIIDKIQLEKGSTATPFSPYSNICPISGWSQVDGKQSGEDMTDYTPITISLGQTVYGGYVDALNGDSESRLAAVTIDGTQALSYNGTYAGKSTEWYYAPGNKANGTENLISDRFKTSASSTDFGTATGRAANGNIFFHLPESIGNDGTAARQWFANNPTQVVYELASPTTLSLTTVSVSSLLGQNNIWCNTGDTELDYYPAAASVVAVLNRSSKVYTSIPLGKIRYDTYQTTPNQALDLDSYRAETGVLIRNVLSHTATKIEFNTPSMTNLQWEEVWNIIKAGFNNSTERKLKLKYYDQMSATYKTGWFYVPDVQFTIRNIDEANGIINYDEVRVAFIEY